MDDSPGDMNVAMPEITARLGEPDAVYQSNLRSMAWRFVIGVIIVIAAAVLHYLVWTGGIPAFKLRHIKAWIFLGLAMTVGPATGLYLIYFAVRGLKMWVLQYPTGLFVWHRGVVYALPWNEISFILFRGLPSKAELRSTTTAYFDLARATRRLFGTEIILVRDDDAKVSLLSILNDFPALGEQIQQRVYDEQASAIDERLQAGETVAFGDVSCSREQLTVGTESFRWRDISKLERAKNKYIVKSKPRDKHVGDFDLEKVPNLHIFLRFAHDFIAQYADDEATS